MDVALLDTDILSELLKQHKSIREDETWARTERSGWAAVSPLPTWQETYILTRLRRHATYLVMEYLVIKYLTPHSPQPTCRHELRQPRSTADASVEFDRKFGFYRLTGRTRSFDRMRGNSSGTVAGGLEFRRYMTDFSAGGAAWKSQSRSFCTRATSSDTRMSTSNPRCLKMPSIRWLSGAVSATTWRMPQSRQICRV